LAGALIDHEVVNGTPYSATLQIWACIDQALIETHLKGQPPCPVEMS